MDQQTYTSRSVMKEKKCEEWSNRRKLRECLEIVFWGEKFVYYNDIVIDS